MSEGRKAIFKIELVLFCDGFYQTAVHGHRPSQKQIQEIRDLLPSLFIHMPATSDCCDTKED